MTQKRIVVGITGGSGALYAVRLVDVLLRAGSDVYLSISGSGATVIKQELGLTVDLHAFDDSAFLRALHEPMELDVVATGKETCGRIHYCHHSDMMATIASGSFTTAGMVVCPCSGSTLSAIAHASSNNLIQRAAEVHLKERRKLVLVPRETPLSLPQINNMKSVTEAGAVVLPASPGFYHGAKTIRDLVDFIVARICDQLGVENQLVRRWGEEKSQNDAARVGT